MLAGSGGMRERRVLSRSRPATPACMILSCQRHTVTLLVPAWRMISPVPNPPAVSKTICALHTCFCGLFRSATIASSRTRSAADTSTVIPSRMPHPPLGTREYTPLQDSYVRFIPRESNMLGARARGGDDVVRINSEAFPARGARNNVKETWQHAICDPLGRRLSVWRDPLPPYRRTDISGGLSLHRLQAPIGIGVRNESENAKGGC